MGDELIRTTDGEHVRFGKGLGTRRIVSASAFGLVEHDLPPGQLGSPVHTHTGEDEYSFVLSGRLSALVGEDTVEAGAGELLVKPRGIPHAFWNSGTEVVRFLELIAPGGFEEYFFELADPFNARDQEGMARVRERYGLEVRAESIPELLERHGLQPPF